MNALAPAMSDMEVFKTLDEDFLSILSELDLIIEKTWIEKTV